MEPKNDNFWVNVGIEMDPEMDPKINQKIRQNWNQNKCKMLHMRMGVGKCKYCKLWLQVQVQIMSDE